MFERLPFLDLRGCRKFKVGFQSGRKMVGPWGCGREFGWQVSGGRATCSYSLCGQLRASWEMLTF